MPEIHRNNPNRNTHPLSLRPTRRGGSRTAPITPIAEVPPPTTTVSPITATTPSHNNHPLSREPSPSPSQGEIKRGFQGEGNRAAKGRYHRPNPQPFSSPKTPLTTNSSSFTS